MADYTSKYTGVQIDNAVAQSSKIPTIENNVGALQTGKQDKLSDEQLNNIAAIPNKANSADIPSELPNPFDLIINGEVYNGTKEVEINVEGGEIAPATQTKIGGLYIYYDEVNNNLYLGDKPIEV